MKSRPRLSARARAAGSIASGLCAGFLLFAYLRRPDWAAALTLFPAWSWLPLGLASLLPARNRLVRVGAPALWALFLLLAVEEPRSLLRAALPDASEHPGRVRFVSFNCGGGGETCLAEVAATRPDVVFLQESPSEETVRAFLRRRTELPQHLTWSPDASVLTRSRPVEVSQPSSGRPFYTRTLIEDDARVQEFVSLRLDVSPPLFNLLSPRSWSAQRSKRQAQRQQLRTVLNAATRFRSNGLLVIAGDFNVPQRDGILALMRPFLRDAFAQAGRGLGNTILNDVPVLRIDQVWLSRGYCVLQARAQRSEVSDHRMVVVDAALCDEHE